MSDTLAPEFERLNKLLGFDPGKQIGPNGEGGTTAANVFAEAMKKVVAERAAANEAKAVTLIKQLIDLKGKWDEEERKFMGQRKKFFKDFNKTLGKIEALARGETLASVEAKEAEDGEKKEACSV